MPPRLSDLFAGLRARHEAALMPYVMCGYPDLETSETFARALIAGGGDALELGVPFSDPLADGATIQRAGQRALENGVTLDDCLGMAKRLSATESAALVLMGYYNPFLRYGIKRLARAVADAGIAGMIVPDLPPEEAGELRNALAEVGVDLVGFAAPTSTEERLTKIAAIASGFIYCVSLTGTTGARAEMNTGLEAFLARVRAKTDLPLAVGFGVSRPEHVRRVTAVADGAIIASGLIDLIDRTAPADRPAALQAFVTELKAETRRVPVAL